MYTKEADPCGICVAYIFLHGSLTSLSLPALLTHWHTNTQLQQLIRGEFSVLLDGNQNVVCAAKCGTEIISERAGRKWSELGGISQAKLGQISLHCQQIVADRSNLLIASCSTCCFFWFLFPLASSVAKTTSYIKSGETCLCALMNCFPLVTFFLSLWLSTFRKWGHFW